MGFSSFLQHTACEASKQGQESERGNSVSLRNGSGYMHRIGQAIPPEAKPSVLIPNLTKGKKDFIGAAEMTEAHDS